ncbi:hypothetical protein EJB05_38877, partial [Eragrostis curvula]
MGEENDESAKSITVELRLYMHCDASERLVRRSVKKIEGVEVVDVDREENKVTVTGDFKTEKKKKTGKRAEILVPEENKQEGKGEEPDPPSEDQTYVVHEYQNRRQETWNLYYFDDENAEGCVARSHDCNFASISASLRTTS